MSQTHPLTTTAFELPGFHVVKSFGVVRGIIVRSRSIIGNIGAGLQSIIGGNISLYTSLCERAREDAFNDMLSHAGQLGANAVIGVRYDATEISAGITEVLCYGTAVYVEQTPYCSLFSTFTFCTLHSTLYTYMAGHSKWAKVKHFKGAIDAKRGKIFSKLSKEIAIAAKIGGGDAAMNPRLRMVLLKCRAANMPNDNIERAIKKGTGGGETATFEDLTYEIYGPNGVAILLELSTDNRNRTASEIRSIVTKNNGSIATQGSVSRLFHRKGQIIVPRESAGEDQLMEVALEAGAEDFKAEPQGFEILTDPSSFEAVHKQIEAKGIKPAVAEITALPSVTVPLADETAASAVNKLLDALEDHDDVKEVYSNAELPD